MSEDLRLVTVTEHYDRLAEEGNGLNDPPEALDYMSRWDGPLFWSALGDVPGKDVFEVGVGVGRLASQVLEAGCRSFTGLDLSPKTAALAETVLNAFPEAEVVQGDICEFHRPESYDIAYSVLTFMHMENKKKALSRMVQALRPGGRIVLSISRVPGVFHFNDRSIVLHPLPAEDYCRILQGLGCVVDAPVPLIDRWTGSGGEKTDTFGEEIAALVKAERRS